MCVYKSQLYDFRLTRILYTHTQKYIIIYLFKTLQTYDIFRDEF